MNEAVRLNFQGGVALTRDIFAHVMTDAGFDVLIDGATPSESDVTVVIADDDARKLLTTSNLRRVVIVADIDPTDESVAELVIAGADAVVNLQSTAQDLAQVIKTVAAGGSVIAPRPARRVSELARAGRAANSPDVPTLTNREVDILRCIGRGLSVKETAATLGITPKTVENLQSRLFKKLDVRNRAQAFAQAHALGLLPSEMHLEIAPD